MSAQLNISSMGAHMKKIPVCLNIRFFPRGSPVKLCFGCPSSEMGKMTVVNVFCSSSLMIIKLSVDSRQLNSKPIKRDVRCYLRSVATGLG